MYQQLTKVRIAKYWSVAQDYKLSFYDGLDVFMCFDQLILLVYSVRGC